MLSNNEILSTTVTVSSAGKHTLKLYNVSSGMVIDKIVLVKGDVQYSYFGAPESYNTTYNNEITLPETTADTPKDESEITKTFEPDFIAAAPLGSYGEVIKLTDKYDSAVAARVDYDSDGNIVSVKTKKLDFTDVDISGSIQINDLLNDLSHISDTAATELIVFDNYTNLEPVAPILRWGEIATEAESSNMRVSADLSEHIGKKSIVLVADEEITEDITDEHIKYLYAEDITNKSYKSIPFADNADGVYNIRVGIDGEQPINETRTTVINITPDNDGAKVYDYHEDFSDYTVNASDWHIGSKASVPALDSGSLKFSSSGDTVGVYTDIPEINTTDRKLNIVADIKFTKPTGSPGNSQFTISNTSPSFASKQISYGVVTDGVREAGHIIVFEYNTASALLVNGESVTTDFIGDWIHMESEANFKVKTVTITLTNAAGKEVTLENLPFYSTTVANNIGSYYLRAAKSNATTSVDNIEIYTKTAPQYAMSITAVDSGDNEISNAKIKVKNASGTEITAEDNGKYMLVEGEYTITVTADGYETKEQKLSLTPALESKTVKVKMN